MYRIISFTDERDKAPERLVSIDPYPVTGVLEHICEMTGMRRQVRYTWERHQALPVHQEDLGLS